MQARRFLFRSFITNYCVRILAQEARELKLLLLGKEIINLQDTPIIYLQNKEVEISSSILNNINEKPQDYYLFIEKESIEKEKYLKVLEELFLSEELRKKQKSKMQRLNNIVESMQRWYRSLDQYTLTFTKQLFEENEQGYLEEDVGKNEF